MIKNNFEAKDTLERRVDKLNEQTGLDFVLRDSFGRVYLERSGQHFTGAMSKADLIDWTAVFALGYRMGHACASGDANAAVVTNYFVTIQAKGFTSSRGSEQQMRRELTRATQRGLKGRRR